MAIRNPAPLVTKASMIGALQNPNPLFIKAYVGRALVALFARQTRDEQATNQTRLHNQVGFTGADGRSGALSAKSFLKNKTLADWQVERWTRLNKNGEPRLVKYHKQLNEIALRKRMEAARRHETVKAVEPEEMDARTFNQMRMLP